MPTSRPEGGWLAIVVRWSCGGLSLPKSGMQKWCMKANLVKQKRSLHPEMIARHVKNTLWQLHFASRVIPVLSTILLNIAPYQEGLKDHVPFRWCFLRCLFTMAQAALACQIAPALDTDEDTGYPPFQGRPGVKFQSISQEGILRNRTIKNLKMLLENCTVCWETLWISVKVVRICKLSTIGCARHSFGKGCLHRMKTRRKFFHNAVSLLSSPAWYWWCCRAAGWISIFQTTEESIVDLHQKSSGSIVNCTFFLGGLVLRKGQWWHNDTTIVSFTILYHLPRSMRSHYHDQNETSQGTLQMVQGISMGISWETSFNIWAVFNGSVGK